MRLLFANDPAVAEKLGFERAECFEDEDEDFENEFEDDEDGEADEGSDQTR
jgi:hypothetical protein